MSLKLNGSSAGSVSFDAPSDTSPSGTDVTLTLPTSAGSAGQYLRNSGTAGTLEFGALTSGDMPTGSILQVVQTVKTDVESFASANTNSFVDIPGMSVTITPTSSTSKILVLFNVNVAQTTTATIHIRLIRGSTGIFQGDAASNRLGSTQIVRHQDTPYLLNCEPLAGQYLDSPATTSATTYKLAGTLGATYNGTFYLNRSGLDSDADYGPRTASSITLMEVAA
jgi:hypothetical protein